MSLWVIMFPRDRDYLTETPPVPGMRKLPLNCSSEEFETFPSKYMLLPLVNFQNLKVRSYC